MQESDIICFSDSALGVYIPRHFAESIKREIVTGVTDQDWQDLTLDPYGEDSEILWETWNKFLDNARVHHNGIEYVLYQDGDLFLVPMDQLESWIEG